MNEPTLTKIKAATAELLDHFQIEWQAISTARFDRDLELAVLDRDGTHALVFPCRRVLRGWIKATTNEPVNVHPTHWRDWDSTVSPLFSRSAS
jgi:hypothetical protein